MRVLCCCLLASLCTIATTAQGKHFYMGCAVQARHFCDSADSLFIKQVVRDHFDIVTLTNDLKWNNWGKENKRFSKTYIDHALQWLKKNQVKVKGHHIVWGPLKKESNYRVGFEEEYFHDFLRHTVEKIEYTRDYVNTWDFLNHPVELQGYSDYFDEKYSFDQLLLLQDTLKKLLPSANLGINEGGILSKINFRKRGAYYQKIEDYLANGIDLSYIGFMGHFHDTAGKIDTAYIHETLDIFSEFEIPIVITEFDYRFGEMAEKIKLSEAQLLRQAKRTRLLLDLFYMHPNVAGVILWGFWEQGHWYPSAALWDQSKRIKPNGEVLLEFLDEIRK